MVSPERIFDLQQDSGASPQLLVVWESPRRVFFSNLKDSLVPKRQPTLLTSSAPGIFWEDVFVHRPIATRFILDSYALHILAVLVVYFVFSSPLFWNQRLPARNPYEHTTLEYYSVSEYLPPVRAAQIPPRRTIKGQPTYAKQQIISVPPEPDNSRQTIVTPDLHVIARDVPLPNMMSWGDSPEPIQPLAASANLNSNPKLLTPPDIISPPAEEVPRSRTNRLMQADVINPPVDDVPNSRRNLALDTEPIRPAPDIQGQKSRTSAMIQPSVIEPPPSAEALRRAPGSMNVSRLESTVLQPQLAVPEQRAAVAPPNAPATTRGEAASRTAPPPAPSVQGLGSSRGSGQLMALSAQPAPVLGPIEIPRGTRRGVFAADPTGSLGAPGTPNLVAEKNGDESSASGAGGSGASAHVSEGIFVAPGPKQPATGTVVATTPTPAPPSPKPDLSLKDRLLAAMRGVTADVSKTPPATTPPKPAERKIEDKIFGDKKYYSMILNMPNLNSSAGSWIVRFAELNPTENQTELSAPVALNKVDPAYPSEMIRDKVEGTVVLYAVIRASGVVDSVRVLQSVDDRLDKSAISALQHWRFRPGTKKGLPVDIEAVVQIPFRLAALKY